MNGRYPRLGESLGFCPNDGARGEVRRTPLVNHDTRRQESLLYHQRIYTRPQYVRDCDHLT